MADENVQNEQPEKKKKSPLKLIIIVVLVLLLGGGGFVAYKMFLAKPEVSPEEAEEAAKEPEKAYGSMYAMTPFVVNLSDPGGKRYLKAKIELEYLEEAVVDELNGRLPQIRDVILLLLSSKTLEEIQGVEGKIALRNEILLRVNQLLASGRVKNVYFTEFVIQ